MTATRTYQSRLTSSRKPARALPLSGKERTRRRLAKQASMKKLHDKRRRKRLCINNATHGKARKGGRCDTCWDDKLAAERDDYAARKMTPGG